MLPNRFPDCGGEVSEFNSVDASLWYVIAVYAWFEAMRLLNRPVSPSDQATLQQAIHAILTGLSQGTRFGIRCDADGLLAAGVPGVQLTWMDAKAGDWVVTPRIGKPVEVQVLWINALWVGSGFSARWGELFERAREAFRVRFWNELGGYLYDVVDVDHQPGKIDASFRPNQLFAVVGYPVALIEGDRARRILDAVEARLWTPMGLRSLAPGEPGYAPHYRGGVQERDGAYHQGTVWPWLMGPFVEAWVRVRGRTRLAKREARRQFLAPLLRYMEEIGFGHLCEVADGAPPHTPRGCPFQAWSVAEVLRLLLVVLQEERVPRRPRRGRSLFSRSSL
jgi:predicted glycogen debranching enzyme